MSLHSRTSVDVDALRAGLDRIRADVVTIDGVALELAFSVGIADAAAGSDLADLMARADLLVYEDKAVRTAARQAAAGRSAPDLARRS